MSTLTYKAGQVIFRQGYPADNAYLIEQGEVEIYNESAAGEETRVALLAQGQMFGEYGVLDDAPRSASARALTDVMLRIMAI